jgi:hypothetical protein
MKIFRGPHSKSFYEGSHEYVAQISPEALEKGVRQKAHIRFNITKDGRQRAAVCTAVFEDADLVPVAKGLLARLASQQDCLSAIRAVVAEVALSDSLKLKRIKEEVSKLK